MNKQKICNYLNTIANLRTEEIEKYDAIIDKEIQVALCSLKEGIDADDDRIICLVGAKANLDIALSKYSEDGVYSFSAGDISISENDNYLEKAQKLVDLAYKDCVSLVKDDSFAFLGV